MLAAHFFLPNNVSDELKEKLVNDVTMELGLNKARNTIIGDEKVRGVSGGERKRANVGVQLISNPKVLFLDEPTSGLDSFQAQSVMESMRNLSQNGRLVISVIHQPRSSIYDMFDRLLLLSEGKTMFLGNANDAVPYFAALGQNCPRLFNPSDFFLDILSPDYRSAETEKTTSERILYLGDKWIEKENSTALEPLMNGEVGLPAAPHSCFEPWDFKRIRRNFMLLCWRTSAEQTRELPTLFIKFFITIFFALVIGGVYSNTDDSQKGIANRTGLLFVISINQGFNGVSGVLNTFPKEKVIVNRERSARAYDTISYFCAKYLVELPINCMPCVIFGSIIYGLAHLNPPQFGYFLLILMLEACTAISLGLAVSALVPTVEAANAAGPPVVIIALLFGGFFINLDSLPIVANWIPYLSFLKWTFECLAINEFKGAKFSCGGQSYGACETTGEQVLKRLKFGDDTIYDAVFGLSMVLIGFTVSAYLILDRSKISYMPLNFIGSKQASRKDDDAVASNNGRKVADEK